MLEEILKRGYKVEGKICVSTDTRNLPEGCVFFALHGANFNGNRFAMQALEMGAMLAVVDEDISATCSQNACFSKQIIRVDNTLTALQELAREWRRHWSEMPDKEGRRRTVVGITGTNGKTTTKELCAAVLGKKYNVHYTQGNLNNQVGVPLTLLQLTSEHELAIVEMGASHPGDIRELVEIAEPDCGLITNVGKAHLLGFGSFEGVMQTKAELYDWLTQHNGSIFINEDNQCLQQMLADSMKKNEKQESAIIGYHTGVMLGGTHLVGNYNSENVQAAICVGEHFGVSRESAEEAIREYVPQNNRSQLLKTENNVLVVDAYNANPTSMHAAIKNFVSETTVKLRSYYGDTTVIPRSYHGDTTVEGAKMLILGDMLELGEYAHTEHQNIVNMLLEQKVEDVILVGKEFAQTTAPYQVFTDVNELQEFLREHPVRGKEILLKGSHGIHLEKVIELL